MYGCSRDFYTSMKGGEFMAIRTERMVSPRKQFSKWLARIGTIVWGIYAFVVLALIAYRPEAAMASVWLTLIMTCNKALDTISYTRNSIAEKLILAGIERTKIEIGLKGIGKSIAGTHSKDDEDDDSFDDDSEDEGGDNG